jgi:hypothetical protein
MPSLTAPPTLTNASQPTVLFNLRLVRASILYTFKILLPQIVLTMVAFSTFWLSPECGERLGLAITVPLAVAVYDLLVFNSLPTSNKSEEGLWGVLQHGSRRMGCPQEQRLRLLLQPNQPEPNARPSARQSIL